MPRDRQNLLFLCSRNRWRSPTAERIFARCSRLATRSRGLSASAARRVGAGDIEWADVIFVMEADHKRRLLDGHRDAVQDRPIHVLEIEDEYKFMDPELVGLIRIGVETVIGPT